jgi:hypothetical protein
MNDKWFYLLLFGLLVGSPILRGQIVNIEDRRSIQEDTIGWFGNADLSFSLRENGTTIFNVGGNLQIERINGPRRWLFFANYSQTRIDNDRVINQDVVHLRFNQQLREFLTWEAFVQHQYNERLRLKLRMLAGTGPRIKLLDKGKNEIYFGASYMYEYDELADTSLIYRDHRLSTYLSFHLKPWSNLTLASTTYYQPRLWAFSDPRVSTSASAMLGINEHLSFVVQFTLSHDGRMERDLENVVGTIYTWQNSIRVRF